METSQVDSLISDEALFLDNHCVNGRPNLTIQDVVSRLKQTRNVDLFPGNLEQGWDVTFLIPKKNQKIITQHAKMTN